MAKAIPAQKKHGENKESNLKFSTLLTLYIIEMDKQVGLADPVAEKMENRRESATLRILLSKN